VAPVSFRYQEYADSEIWQWVNNWLGETATPSVKGSVTSSVQMVTATIDGQVVSWPNNWFGGASSPTPAPTTETAPAISEPANDENVGALLKFRE
jgi:hypothetical protein